jgi:HD-like signal output (HDOD) protein
MNRILFVDDEPRVLEGLRRMLHPVRREWDMEFVLGGQEALDRMTVSPFDVVVSDMRMPGMDGSEVLDQVMQRFPATVRMILSGQCHRDAVLRTVGLAHQFLTKPCDSETLKAAVLRACRSRDRVKDAGYRQVVSRVKCVPSSPAAYSALVAELESAEPSVERLGQIVSRDVGMTAKFLQLVSSGFFGSPQKSVDPVRWAAFLGIETIRQVAASAGVVGSTELNLPLNCSMEALGAHSRKVAGCAAAIAAKETDDATLIGHAYLGGLLHDVGLLVLAEHFPKRFAETWTRSRAERVSIGEVESRSFCTTHADLGGYLLALWGVPDAIVDATACHHRPSRSPATSFSPLTAVHVADAVADAAALGVPVDAGFVDVEYVTRTRCAGRLHQWYDICEAIESREVPS